MGGCRCTYRNCSLRTDGKTHMFHYPVFDKVRCHQWLTNAHKLEFLNLKVSQLKNRVVCQHHFKDDSFMNFKKDKLTFDAVPAQDGPYCDSSRSGKTKTEQDESKVFSISLDDIENEYLTLGDKRANFSVKYGDFLTNCDLMDLDSLNSLNQINDNNQISIKGLCELEPVPNVPTVQVLSKRSAKSKQPLTGRNREKRAGYSSRSIKKKTPCNKDALIQGNPTVNQDNTVDVSQLIETMRTKEDKKSLDIVLNISHVPVEFESTKSNDEVQENLHQSKLNDQSIDITVFNESKLLNDQSIDVKAFDESKLLNDQSIDVRGFNESKLLNENDQSVDVRVFNESKLSNDQSIDVRAFGESKLLNDQTIDIKAFGEPKLLNDQSIDLKVFDESKLLNDDPFDVKLLNESKLLIDKPFDVKVLNEPKLSNSKSLLEERKKIRIISEKKISEPVPLIGKFEPVSPTRILTFPNKRKFLNPNPIVEIPELPINSALETSLIATDTSKDNAVLERAESEPMNIISSRKDNVSPHEIINDVKNFIPNEVLPNNAYPQKTKSDVISKSPNEVSPKTLLIRNRIPPERVAAIAEKRKFNMKLRDIIEDCLDKLDGPDKSKSDLSGPSNSSRQEKVCLDKRKTNTVESKNQQVRSYLAKSPELPHIQDYTIAYLEARMKKMENNLLNKIEENSQKIVDLKQTFAPPCGKKSVHTQTSVSEDVHKKQLYQELSKYLSQEANSLVYEELFINKYTKDVPQGPSSRKRRRRR